MINGVSAFPGTPRPARPTVTQIWLAVVAAALFALIVPATPAAAHSELLSSDPAEGAALETTPAQVTLTFGEAVIGEFTQVRVSRDGAALDVPSPTSRDNVVTVDIPAGSGGGSYAVAYQIVSADSHPIAGEIAFTVTLAPTTATPSSASPSSPASASAAASESASNSPAPTGVSTAAADPPGLSGGVLAVGLMVLALGLAALGWAVVRQRRQRS